MTKQERYKMRKFKPIEVSFVPTGAVKEKKFLVIKSEDGGSMALATEEIVKTIMEGDLENGEKLEQIAKEHQLTEDQLGASKAVLRLMGALEDKIPEAIKGELVKLAGYAPAAIKKEETTEGNEDMSDKTPEQKASEERLEKILKENEELSKAKADAEAKASALQAQIDAEKEVQVQKEFVEKAGQFKNLGIKAEEFGPVMKQLSGASPEAYEKLVAVLKAADEQVSKSGVFNEIGSSNAGAGSTTMAQIEAMANGFIQKSEKKMSKQAAMAAVLNTKEGRELYAKYESERGMN